MVGSRRRYRGESGTYPLWELPHAFSAHRGSPFPLVILTLLLSVAPLSYLKLLLLYRDPSFRHGLHPFLCLSAYLRPLITFSSRSFVFLQSGTSKSLRANIPACPS